MPSGRGSRVQESRLPQVIHRRSWLSSLLLLQCRARLLAGGAAALGQSVVAVAEIAYALVLVGTTVALLVEFMMLVKDSALAFAKGALVLGLEAREFLGEVMPCLGLATAGTRAGKEKESTH